MFYKTSLYASPQIFHCRIKFPPILHFPPFFSPKLFSLIFFFFLFIRLPLLKLLKVKNPFFISHPTPFIYLFISNPFSFSPCGALSHISTAPSHLPSPSHHHLPSPNRRHRHRPSCSRRRHRYTLSHLNHHPLPLME